jgi:glycosyltransferase involved in cell wall biosynthesis
MKTLAKQTSWEISACVADVGQAETLEVEGVVLHKTLKLEGQKVLEAIKLFKTIKTIDADVFVLRSADLGVAVAAMMCRVLSKPFVYMVAHDMESRPQDLSRYCGWLGAKGMAWMYRHANALTAQTQHQQSSFFKTYGVKPVFFPNGFKPPESESEKAPVVDPLSQVRTHALWVGRYDTFKNPWSFMRLVKKHPEFKFKMICPSTSFQDRWEELLIEAKSCQNLDFIEGCSHEHLIEAYTSSECCVLTSDAEGYSNVMMEAFYYGCPVLSLHVNPDQLFDDGSLGFCCEGDETKLSETLISWLQNDEALDKMREYGRQKIIHDHGLEACGKRFQELILSMDRAIH